MERKAGVLMPVASLPDRFGCGSFGHEAYEFVDLLAEAGMKVWQILPLNPLGYGNSPYQPFSSYAMDDLYISLDLLYEEGLLEERPHSFQRRKNVVDYDAVRKYRLPYLKEAYKHFKPDHAYTVFAFQQWLRDYSLFMTFKKHNNMRCWNEWPIDMRDEPVNHNMDIKPYEDVILYEVFIQYELFLQWKKLKQYANDKGIDIVGDLPFYVGIDSADVWANRENFLLDQDGRPQFIAGVPPDYFSATGQRWGNPIYNWEYMKDDDYSFLINRILYTGKMFDHIRLDHFRAFDTYWKIPASCPTAVEGEWVEAPGYKVLDLLFKQDHDLSIYAEDLGDMRKEVYELRDHYHLAGMNILEFNFPDNLPEDIANILVYTGTHDNDTLVHWYRTLPLKQRNHMLRRMKQFGYQNGSFIDNMIQFGLDRKAENVIIPLADYLHIGKEGRLNVPSTVGGHNWRWRITDYQKLRHVLPKMKEMILKSQRG